MRAARNIIIAAALIVAACANAASGIVNPSFTRTETGAVARTFTAKAREIVSVMDFGANGDGTTDDRAAIQAAIDAAPSSGWCVLLPVPSGGSYKLGGALTLSNGKDGMCLIGAAKYVTLSFTSTTGNGITIQGEHDNIVLQNLDIRTATTSSGTAISSTATGSASPLRDFEFININIDGFKSGIVIYGHLNGLIRGGRQGGQGKGVAGGVGIQLGEDVNNAGNGATLDHVFVSNYETDIWNKYASPTKIVSSLTGGASVAIKNAESGIIYLDNHYFDSENDTAINNAGYMVWGAQFSSLGTQTVTSTSRRFYKHGHDMQLVRIRRDTAVQGVNSATYTKIQFNSASEDSEASFDAVTNYRFTATYPGFRDVKLCVTFNAGTASKSYKAAIYKNGGMLSEAVATGPATVPGTVTSCASDLVWLAKDDYIEGYAYHDEGIGAQVAFGSEKTWIAIQDAR